MQVACDLLYTKKIPKNKLKTALRQRVCVWGGVDTGGERLGGAGACPGGLRLPAVLAAAVHGDQLLDALQHCGGGSVTGFWGANRHNSTF